MVCDPLGVDVGGTGPEQEVERLAAVMDAEVRAEQADYERMALQAEWRARSLADVARELMVRGDLVEVRTGAALLVGRIVHVGTDLAVLRTARGPVDVVLPRAHRVRVIERARSGGTPPARGARTFRARLTEHQVAAVGLTLLTADGEEVEGVVEAVAEDHVLVSTRHGLVVLPEAAVVASWPTTR